MRRLISVAIEPRADATQAQPTRSPPEITRLQQADMPFQHLTASCPPQLLPWLLNNGGITPSSPTTNTLKFLENLEAARNVNQTQLSSLWSTLQNNQTIPTSSSAPTNPVVSELSHAVASLGNTNMQGESPFYSIITPIMRVFRSRQLIHGPSSGDGVK